MALDLRVLEHLGINLYSNAAAVLSEAVANCWDADATDVNLTIERDRIVIVDNGLGMTLAQINDRFLNVGYDKRHSEGDQSGRKRSFMGRKGIGKLALFSIADTVTIDTRTATGEANAFRMETAAIKEAIQQRGTYHPEVWVPNRTEAGTTVVLEALRRRATAASVNGLRKRVARRFTIIGYRGPGGDSFDVAVNGEHIGPTDRDDLAQIEFSWTFGAGEIPPSSHLPKVVRRGNLSDEVTSLRPEWRVRGWIGTVAEPKQLKNTESGNFQGIVVVARGRLIQENILPQLSFNRLMGSYVTGQIEADFLDVQNEVDIATSDRQRLIEDDERYIALVAFLRNSLLAASDLWTGWRNEARGRQAEAENPALTDWLNTLPPAQVVAARKLIGLVRGVELDTEESRADLYRSGISAFERLRLREESHRLGESEVLDAAHLLPLLADLASLEAALYGDLVRSRLDVIRKFEAIVDANEKEKVLQEHLFKNLWLLDPAWERAAGSERVEQTLKAEYPDFADGLSDEQSKGRIDIRYRANGGENIIVELKKAGRKMTMAELLEQGQKYLGALRTILHRQGDSNPHIRIIFVLGTAVKEESDPGLGSAHVETMLKGMGAEVIYYDRLIARARTQYAEYLNKAQEHDRIGDVLRRIRSASP